MLHHDLSAMRCGRPNLSQEKVLWDIALSHFGPEALHQVVRDIWCEAKPPARPLVETLDISTLGKVVLDILLIVKIELEMAVPYRAPRPDQITWYSHHVQHLINGLLDKIPAKQLPRDLRGFKLPVDLGI
jgi:hypothetical protein